MKYLLTFTIFLISISASAQPVTSGSSSSITLKNEREIVPRNLVIPRYQDTTAANADKGVDSSAAVIYTYLGQKTWFKQHNPKKWIEFGSGGVAFPDGLFYIDSIRATGTLQITCYSSIATPTTWRINSMIYSKSTSNLFSIVPATPTYVRKDIIVANTSNNLTLVMGIENPTTAVQPLTPPNTVLVTVVDINGSSVLSPSPDLSGYVTLNTNQYVSGIKTFNVLKANTFQLYDLPLDAYGGLTLANDIFSVQKTDGNNLFKIDNSTFKFGLVGASSTFDATTNSDDRTYRLPDSSGTVALLENIGGLTLQSVTDNGSVTTNNIEIGDFLTIRQSSSGFLGRFTSGGNDLSTDRNYDIPDTSGTIPIHFKIGLTYYSAASNGVVDFGVIGGGSGSANSNIGSGFRLAIPYTNSIKTLFGSYGLVLDSTTNTNGLTAIIDSANWLTNGKGLNYYDLLNGSKQNNISLTTTGVSGLATFSGSTLNIPNYGADTTNSVSGLTTLYQNSLKVSSLNFVANEQFTGSTSSTYTLANTPVASSLDVYKNGIKLPSSEYSFVGTTVTLVSARVSGDIISNSYRK